MAKVITLEYMNSIVVKNAKARKVNVLKMAKTMKRACNRAIKEVEIYNPTAVDFLEENKLRVFFLTQIINELKAI